MESQEICLDKFEAKFSDSLIEDQEGRALWREELIRKWEVIGLFSQPSLGWPVERCLFQDLCRRRGLEDVL